MPLLILIVAGALWFWGTQREYEQTQEIEAHIRDVCQEIHRTRDHDAIVVGQELGISTDLLPGLIDRIRETIPDTRMGLERITIEAYMDDAKTPYGDGTATHHAFIRYAGRDRLGLRIVHTGPPPETEIIGYWITGAAR